MEIVAPPLRKWFITSVARDPDAPDRNEDVFRIDEETGILALCDGAGESFDAKSWAAIVALHFVGNPDPTLPWLGEAETAYRAGYDTETFSWNAQIAFDRGSYATLLGVCLGSGSVEITAVGDSLAILTDGGQLVESFPYREAADFARRPTLLASDPARNTFLHDSDHPPIVIRWATAELAAPVILCMTDALGAWLLEQPTERCPILLGMRDEVAFRELVLEERVTRRLRVDDTTLAILDARGR